MPIQNYLIEVDVISPSDSTTTWSAQALIVITTKEQSNEIQINVLSILKQYSNFPNTLKVT